MSETVIQFDHLGKSYPYYYHITGGLKHFLFNLPKALKQARQNRFVSLHDISFEIQKGETFGVIGRNGAGKSTILGLIAGVLKPTVGRLEVNGRVSPLLELGSGFHFELTGRENIILNGVLMGLSRREVSEKSEEIIAFSGLGEFIDQPIRVYSTGMLARLGFSVVSGLNPEILLLDEILAVGDQNFQKKCMDKMLGFKQNGVTMVFVSHSMQDITVLCDRVIWIENHVVKMLGNAKEVVEQYLKSFEVE
jgi:lipopolysaccharide transport system ATP-binding protein